MSRFRFLFQSMRDSVASGRDGGTKSRHTGSPRCGQEEGIMPDTLGLVIGLGCVVVLVVTWYGADYRQRNGDF